MPEPLVETLARKLTRQLGQVDRRFGLIGPGARIAVAVSGGKDSLALVHLLHRYRAACREPFALLALHVDQGEMGFPTERLTDHLASHGFAFQVERLDITGAVRRATEPGKSPCALCARLRRGVLHRAAKAWDATAIALGHHREDAIETLLLNALHSGRLRSMPALLPAANGFPAVIRPLITCAEADLAAYAEALDAPVSRCACPAAEAPDARRREVRALLTDLTARYPHVPGNLLAALGNVEPEHLLDPSLLK